ncbi:hypothetical protein POVWA1_051880 [Plasmodium ovale wallikeri]|nr:hypothetical protein POVWA1_051880 [Plasmodium ovale wallikeri]
MRKDTISTCGTLRCVVCCFVEDPLEVSIRGYFCRHTEMGEGAKRLHEGSVLNPGVTLRKNKRFFSHSCYPFRRKCRHINFLYIRISACLPGVCAYIDAFMFGLYARLEV